MVKKRNMWLVLWISFLMVFFCQNAFAITSADGIWEYEFEEEYAIDSFKTVMILKEYLGNEKEVIVPSVIDGYKVDKLKSTFDFDKNIEKITIPSGVISLDYAFMYCTNFTEVVLPETVKSYFFAFSSCTSLKEIILPKGIYSIHGAFFECTNLKKVKILGTVTDAQSAFSHCSNLEDVEFSKMSISSDVPSWMELDSAFIGCSSLKSCTIPKGAETLSNTFEKCTHLTTVYLPDSLNRTHNAFIYCYSLKDVYFAGSESAWIERSFGSDPSIGDKLNQATVHFAKPSPVERRFYTLPKSFMRKADVYFTGQPGSP